jgi:hypothetical protein
MDDDDKSGQSTDMMDKDTMDTDMMDKDTMDTDMMDTDMKDSDMGDSDTAEVTYPFTVTIENISGARPYRASGVFNTPDGAQEPGPLTPGGIYSFSFYGAPGDRLSFATMFVHSNDLFYAPGEGGLALFDDSDMPVTGDITSSVHLYNAGTETDQPIGEGTDQAPRQAGPDTGAADMDTTVRAEMGDGLPATADVLQVTLAYNMGMFTASIANVSSDMTLMLGDGTTTAALAAPGVFVVHPDGEKPLFALGAADPGVGLEALAEDGDPSALAAAVMTRVGPPTPLAPGVFAVHGSAETPLFTTGAPDMGYGLEALAEDGDPSGIASHLEMNMAAHGVFNTPDGATEPGPLLPGGAYAFTLEAVPGEHLSFASMYVQSNDLFFAPVGTGIALFDDAGMPITGDVTDTIRLFDAGTEKNEVPGIGAHQAPRQTGPNTGAAEIMPVAEVDDMYYYPPVADTIRVTVSSP